MTNLTIIDARYPALRRFGYTDRESQFLCMAALHSGYFLRRQYCRFINRSVGGTAASFVEKVLGNKHAVVAPGFYGTKLYHLSSRPFFAALGEENNRNRRERQPDAIKRRLMVLDFVIAHPSGRFLATEREKADYFTQERGIDAAILPAKSFGAPNVAPSIHAFPDRYPIYLRESGEAKRPIPTFCFVDEGLAGIARFASYLTAYGPLLNVLNTAQIEYVAASTHNFVGARDVFDHVQGRENGMDRRLTAYFQNRLLFEQQGVGAFDRAKFLEFRDQRQAFSGAGTEAQFEAWKSGPDLNAPSENDQAARANLQFSTYLVEENYDLFGSLANVSSHAS